MVGPVRTPPGKKPVQPPRPPNAWILYRAEKAKEIGRKALADVSREISAMWKSELPHVRAEYERRADIKKAEHQALYPEYRFQPVKREEKERLREAKRQENEREKETQRRGRANPQSQPASTPGPQPLQSRLYAPTPSILDPCAPYYHAEFRYGPNGPTPPLSAAPSPTDSGTSGLPQSRVKESSASPSARTSPYPQTPISAYGFPAMPPSSYGMSLIKSQSPEPDTTPTTVASDPSQWKESHSTQLSSLITTGDNWSNGSGEQGDLQEFLTFNLPSNSMQWTGNVSSEYDDFQAILSATGDPSIFQLSNFDPQSLLDHPTGQLEVSLGNMEFPGFDDPIPDLSDLPFFASQPPSELSNDLTSFFTQIESPTSPSHDVSGIFNGDDYLNFDGHSPDTTLSPSQPTPAPSSAADTTRTPYVPPSGAAHSSTRRVSGTWAACPPSALASSSPINRTPPRTNSVHA
ncbi:hypothetical protein GGX14DRAFT_659531 [Mycena pura]|uniref:HMG box domain-containing protein n=1 Tax=Mycena pura TaxID=153505 RepID=A0AAD6V5Y2_9AGAR|nr:hypothetical protein GGX14DRAFT_659531 [Mycena pura]